MKIANVVTVMSASLLVMATLPAHAVSLETTYSGFLTVAGGQVLGGNHEAAVDQGYDCPCFISDYATSAIYEDNGVDFAPDSKVGLQGRVGFSGSPLSVTGQAVFRGANDGKPNIEWVYAEYNFTDAMTVQLGRKRLPLFYYSESQDVGLSYPWVHLPSQLYGWEIVNYNGANFMYRTQVSGWTLNTEVFAGSETNKDNGYWKIYNGKDSETDAKWSSIRGFDLGLVRDWFEARVVYIQSDVQNKAVRDSDNLRIDDAEFTEKKKQHIYGVSMNVDYENWVLRGEKLFIDRKDDYGTDHSFLLGAGYRMGSWLPMLSFTRYQQNTIGVDRGPAEGHNNTSLVVRYDLTTTSDIKVQYDHWRDDVDEGYGSMHGDSRLLTVAYDMVF